MDRQLSETAAVAAGLTLGANVGEYYWRNDANCLVRRNANGSDTEWHPEDASNKLAQVKALVQQMISSAEVFVANDGTGEYVTAYKVQTAALHKLVPLLECHLLSNHKRAEGPNV